MTAHLLLGLLLTTTLAAPDRPRPAEDPCALGRRIAQSPPCLAASGCEALDLWREHFGPPDFFPAGAGELPPDLLSRLPESEVTLGKLTSFGDAFQRLGQASGIDVLVHPDLAKEELEGDLGPMPVEKVWRALLRAGLVARFDGDRVLVARPSDRPDPRRYRAPTFRCPAR